jgi:D-erythro-7,8-dihydroneopterin triphosphate epimerase
MSIDHALNYKTITESVTQQLEQNWLLLLEKLVSDIVKISNKHLDVAYTKVTVDKPHALGFADSVSLTLERTKKLKTTSTI